jgi:hypothetical protein
MANALESFWDDLVTAIESAVQPVTEALLGAYLNKTSGVAGAPAITAANIGKIVGTVAAQTVLTHISAATTPPTTS